MYLFIYLWWAAQRQQVVIETADDDDISLLAVFHIQPIQTQSQFELRLATKKFNVMVQYTGMNRLIERMSWTLCQHI